MAIKVVCVKRDERGRRAYDIKAGMIEAYLKGVGLLREDAEVSAADVAAMEVCAKAAELGSGVSVVGLGDLIESVANLGGIAAAEYNWPEGVVAYG